MTDLVFPSSLPGLGIKISREPYTNIVVQEAVSGRELRSTWWTSPRYKYQLTIDGMRSTVTFLEFQQLMCFWAAQLGQYNTFLLMDPEDYTVTAHGFGVGNASTKSFQLQRSLLGPIYDTLGGPWLTLSTPRTNLLLYSAALGSWGLGHATVTSNAVIAPDGTATADNLVEASDTDQYHSAAMTLALANSSTYCVSVFVLPAAGTRGVSIQAYNKAGTTHAVLFDLSTGAATVTGGAPSAYGRVMSNNGWYRYYIAFPSGTGGSTPSIGLYLTQNGIAHYNGDGSSSVTFWGGQCVLNSYPSQYIPTTAAPATATPNYWPTIGNGFEPIYDPAPGPLIYIDGVLKTLTTDYTVSNGLVTFGDAPGAAAVLTWTGLYYRRVRFAEGNMPLERIVQNLWKAGSVKLVSVIP